MKRYGPAYRYPQSGWVVLHIEGEPYERGYQHGQLMSAEIADHINTLATARSPKAPADGWRDQRLVVNALFLRRYDKEYLEEMKGIADGAAAAGAKFDGRAVDLLDIVALNSGIEIDFLEANLEATPTWAGGDEVQGAALPAHQEEAGRALQRLRRHRSRPPPTARSSSGTSRCGTSTTSGITTSGST